MSKSVVNKVSQSTHAATRFASFAARFTELCRGRVLTFGFVAIAAAALCSLSSSAAPALVEAAAGDDFYSLGVASDGTVVIAGRRARVEGFFTAGTTPLTFTGIQPVRDDFSPRLFVSRNGEYLVSQPASGAPLLWHRLPTLTSEPLPNTPAWESIVGISWIQNEPVVYGTGGIGFLNFPVLWSRSAGLRDLASVWGPGTPLYGLSENGQLVGGGSLYGELILQYGSETNTVLLHGEGNDNFDITGCSPNGKLIVADFGRTIFSQTVVWSNHVAQLLAQPDDLPARASSAVTDSGFIAGQGRSLSGASTDGEAFLYDPIQEDSFWFQDWWANRSGAPGLNALITWIPDLYEHDGQLYAILQNSGAPFLAIAPVPPIQGTDVAISIAKLTSGTFRLMWPAVTGTSLESCDSLGETWDPAAGAPSLIGTNFVIELPSSTSARFFRVRVQ